MSPDFSKNHFELFDVQRSFGLDAAQLERQYRVLLQQAHPDRHAHLDDAAKRLSLQWSTHINQAYQTLKTPLGRARYLLQLAGVDTAEETNTAMPADFLMEQMEWRESIADAAITRDISALEELAARLLREIHALEAALAQDLDEEHDYAGAALLVRKLRFLEKLDEEIGNAIEAALG